MTRTPLPFYKDVLVYRRVPFVLLDSLAGSNMKRWPSAEFEDSDSVLSGELSSSFLAASGSGLLAMSQEK